MPREIVPGDVAVVHPIATLPPAIPDPDAVPVSVSPRQLIAALLLGGFITEEEAVDAATVGALPASLAAIVDQLPVPQPVLVRITWGKMTEAQRHDPLIHAIISAGLATSEQVDGVFRLAATL